MEESSVEKVYEQLKREAEAAGYWLNPDAAFAKDLVQGLLANEARYGYRACPCRLASGDRAEDLDIVCPCDYRDSDLSDYGACYCALYVSEAIVRGERRVRPVPERRVPPEDRTRAAPTAPGAEGAAEPPGAFGGQPLSKPVWRCTVCGYLCARDQPPEICPICKAKKERFERFA